MKNVLVPLLLGLLALPARAQEDLTAQLPKGAPAALRVKSIDRVDAIVKDWVPMLKALGLGAHVADLEKMPFSSWAFMEHGIPADMVDRTKPIYIGITGDDRALAVLSPGTGAAWEGKKELKHDAFALRRGGALLIGPDGMLQAESRGTPTLFRVDADLVVHVYLGDLIAAEKDNIEKGAAQAAAGIAAAGEIPEPARALALPVVTAFKNGVLSLESLDYGLSWTGERIECEGFVAIQEGSGLRNLLKRAGDPGSTDLVAYLPKDAFVTMTMCMNPDWPGKELKEFVEKAGGGDIGNMILQALSPTTALSDKLAGRVATAVTIMGMAGNTVTLCELKPGVDAKTMFDGFDSAKINDALKKAGIPITYDFQKAVAKQGETEIHRFAMSSDNPMLAMPLATMQGCMAARGNLLYIAMSPNGEDDVKALLDKVQRDEKVADHPHAQAMARLGRGYNIGFTFNVGALKQPIRMFALFGVPPQVIQAVQAIPDVLTLSTAITFPDGNIRWRGDWPVKEVAKAAETIIASMPQEKKPEKEEGGDEEFD